MVNVIQNFSRQNKTQTNDYILHKSMPRTSITTTQYRRSPKQSGSLYNTKMVDIKILTASQPVKVIKLKVEQFKPKISILIHNTKLSHRLYVHD